MRFDVVTIFPELFPGALGHGVIGKAIDRGVLHLAVHDLRAYADPPHFQVDDEPFGGGAGMVFKPEPLDRAITAAHTATESSGLPSGPTILMTPQGQPLDHGLVEELAAVRQMTIVCGRYEGIDERIREKMIDREISIGDYVLTGGELPAMVLVEAVGRLQPDALGDPASARHDSFVDGLLDHPHYTRPAEYHGWTVPEVLRSGDHGAIARWRRAQALRRTALSRPDLLADADLSAEDRRLLEES